MEEQGRGTGSFGNCKTSWKKWKDVGVRERRDRLEREAKLRGSECQRKERESERGRAVLK